MEEYGKNFRFMRETDCPSTANRGSSPRKARYTGASLAGLKENRRSGKLSKKIDKYNEEYARLSELAAQVDVERKAVEEGTLDYAEVQKSIKAYNTQARRLAEIGVEVLVLNKDIQKITFAREEAAKAIKVPGFLIGPLRLLSAAGREKARLERESREEREQAIFESIVTTAEEALGQVKDSQIDGDKFDSLEFANVAQTVQNDLVSEPTTDIPEEGKDETVVVENPVEKPAEKTPEELAKEEEAKKQAAEAVANRNKAISDGLTNAYRKTPNPKKMRETTEAVQRAVAEDNNFAVLANVNESFHIALVKTGSGYAKMLETFVNGERKLITPSMFGAMSGLEDKDEIKANYMKMVAISELASHWNKVATYEIQESEDNVKGVEAFGVENAKLFEFVVASVRDGLTAEEINAKANGELTDIEAKVVASVVAKYDVVQAGVTALDSFMEVKEKTTEAVVEETPVNDDMVAKKREAVAATIARLAVSTKYGLNRTNEDEAVVENTNTGDTVIVDPPVDEHTDDAEVINETSSEEVGENENDTVVEEPVVEEVPVAKTGTSYVSQIGILVDEISALSTHRARLKEILGDEANEQLIALERAISSRLTQINALALGGIVTLGKDGHTNEVEEELVEETEVVNETPADEVTENTNDTVVEEETPVVLPDAASIEMTIEEKAEIDARVVNGAHVKVDAIIENFIPGKKYVLEVRVKGKKATLVVEDEEEVLEETPVVTEAPVEEPVVENTNTGDAVVVDSSVVNDQTDALAEDVTEEEVIDEEHADVIDWWTRMGPTLDNPDAQMALRLQGALKEADRAADQANYEIDRRNWEQNRAQRIADGWLPQDEEARKARIAEQERLAEQIARNKLKKCKLFEGLDDADSYIDGIIAENDDLNNARDVVEMIRTKAPEAYKEMETRYRDEQHEKLAAISEEAKGRSK